MATGIRQGVIATLVLLGSAMIMSCMNWQTVDVPILDVVIVTNTVDITLPCTLFKTAKELRSMPAIDQFRNTDISRTNWVYSTLPVQHLRYSSKMNLLFLVPTQATRDNRVYFLAIPRTDAVDVKMTAVSGYKKGERNVRAATGE